MKLHPTSLIAGAALFASILALSSAAPQTALTGSPGVIHHEGAHPRQIVSIEEGVPFTVPSNRLLVMDHLGMAELGATSQVYLAINTQRQVSAWLMANSGACEVSAMPVGRIVAQPGDTVTVHNGFAQQGRAWGYLTDL